MLVLAGHLVLLALAFAFSAVLAMSPLLGNVRMLAPHEAALFLGFEGHRFYSGWNPAGSVSSQVGVLLSVSLTTLSKDLAMFLRI